jgi:hypothetical protein
MPSRAFARARIIPALATLAGSCTPDDAAEDEAEDALEERQGALELVRRAAADATVVDGAVAASNFGNTTTLALKQGPVGSNAWAYLTFDVASLGGGVGSATLRLFGRLNTGSGSPTATARAAVYGVANTAWTEAGVTWQNKPAPDGSALAVATLDRTIAWRTWDVTAYVKAEVATGKTRVSFALKTLDPTAVYVEVASDEAPMSRPELAVSTIPPPVIAGCPVFPPDNEWNRIVAYDPVDPDSDAYLAKMNASGRTLHPDFGSDPTYGIPWITVPGTQPKVPMTFTWTDESDAGPYPYPADAPIENGATSTGDRHVIVLDRDACKLYETFNTWFVDPGWRADAGAVFDLGSNTLRPDGFTSADGAGLPILPGLVRRAEVLAGRIPHALRFTVGHTQRAYVHPATHFSSATLDPTFPPMGLRVRLKATFDISGYSAANRVILTAMKEYGMFLADNGGDWYFTGESNGLWNDDELNQLKSVPASAFEVVKLGAIHR